MSVSRCEDESYRRSGLCGYREHMYEKHVRENAE
jgi:hypothetical protein